MGFYRRRPTPPIEARQFSGVPDKELVGWPPGGRLVLVGGGRFELHFKGASGHDLVAVAGDWIVMDSACGFRPVKDTLFQATYEEAHPRPATLRQDHAADRRRRSAS